MDNLADDKLRAMTLSLKEIAGLASELNMGFVAQLLSMAVLEINIQLHGISEQELEVLCTRIEEKTSSNVRFSALRLIESGKHNRRPRARRI